MTRGAAFVLAAGATCAALAYGGIWMYGDGFIFNRFTGTVIYVDLPGEEEDTLDARATRLPSGGADSGHRSFDERPRAGLVAAAPDASGPATSAEDPQAPWGANRTSRTSWSCPWSRVSSRSTETGVPKRFPSPLTMPIATGVRPGRFDR